MDRDRETPNPPPPIRSTEEYGEFLHRLWAEGGEEALENLLWSDRASKAGLRSNNHLTRIQHHLDPPENDDDLRDPGAPRDGFGRSSVVSRRCQNAICIEEIRPAFLRMMQSRR